MSSVADVLKPDFARSWHEAVAIVQEVASQFAPGISIPGPEDLLLDRSGELQFGFGSESNHHPVTSLALLLQALLDGIEAPGGLRDLARDNAQESPALTTVEGFRRALAFYERPNRVNDLQAVVSRLQMLRPLTPDPEFERLREKVKEKVEAEEPAKKPKRKAPPQRHRYIAAAAAVGGGLLAAIVVYAGPAYFGGAADRVEQRLASSISHGLDKMGTTGDSELNAAAAKKAEAPEPDARVAERTEPSALPKAVGVSTAGQRPAATPQPDSKPVRRDGYATARRLVPGPAVFGANLDPVTRASIGLDRDGPVAAVLDGGPMVSVAAIDLTPAPGVYNRSDPDVDPPVFYRPQLPRHPAPGADTGYFDILVNENGEVDELRLISPMHRFQERMLMAAAKAWKFRPALRNGQPVKYRMRVPIILTGLP